jgi:hypothetical protein
VDKNISEQKHLFVLCVHLAGNVAASFDIFINTSVFTMKSLMSGSLFAGIHVTEF